MAVLNKLSSLGLKVAIDDFGTGYSSLSCPKYLRVNKLKIDQSLVRDLPDDRDDAAITRGVIALGHNLWFQRDRRRRGKGKPAGIPHSGRLRPGAGLFLQQAPPAADVEALVRLRNPSA